MRGYVSGDGACGDGGIDVKGTEVNTKKGLKTRRFRELGVFSGFRIFSFWGACSQEKSRVELTG